VFSLVYLFEWDTIYVFKWRVFSHYMNYYLLEDILITDSKYTPCLYQLLLFHDWWGMIQFSWWWAETFARVACPCTVHFLTPSHSSRYSSLQFFKVAILTFCFNLPSSNRLNRHRSEARAIQPNLPYYNQAPCCSPRLDKVTYASLRYRSARLSPSLMPLTSRRP